MKRSPQQLLVGEKYGLLTVIEVLPYKRYANGSVAMRRFRCECGEERVTNVSAVRRGKIKSCGCNKANACREGRKTHGMFYTAEYRLWSNIIDRCENPNNPSFSRYGGRGIRLCAEWRISFDAFFAGVGNKPGWANSLDRVDNDKGYDPGNVRWSTHKEQARNKSNTVRVIVDGETICVAELCERNGLPASRVRGRLKAGYSLDVAVSNTDLRIFNGPRPK